MTTHTALVETYFARADGADIDAYLELFATGAIVEDDGHRYRGLEALRAWRSGTIPVRTEVLDITVLDIAENGATIARARISGDFPGSPVVLTFRFGFDDDDRITALTIAP